MRNYFAIAFSCVYLTLTVGVAKTTHYCMGREKSSSLFSFTTEKCPCYIFMKDVKSCCVEDHELIKIDDDQNGGPTLTAPVPSFNFIAELFILDTSTPRAADPAPAQDENKPPPKLPLYKSLCSLVFYDSKV